MRPSVVPDMQRKAACEAADCFRTTNPRVKSLTDAIGTGTPSGRFFFHSMARFSEMERERDWKGHANSGARVAESPG